jgi:hypothetical protein
MWAYSHIIHATCHIIKASYLKGFENGVGLKEHCDGCLSVEHRGAVVKEHIL